MSRVGKQTIEIPEKVEITQERAGEFIRVSVKGPLGALERNFSPKVKVVIEGKSVTFAPISDSVPAALWGTTAAHLINMIEGVTKGYEKKLVIEGIGYRAELSGTTLVFALGFSHPVKLEIPKEIKVKVEKNILTLNSVDKDSLGQFAAVIVSHKKPEPYKGKGILYQGQYVRRKQGKRSTA